MTEPHDNADNGPDFSFLGNDSVNDAPGELDFSAAPQQDTAPDFPDLAVEPAQPATHGLEAGSSESTDNTEIPAQEDPPQASTDSTPTQPAISGTDDVARTDSTKTRPTSATAANSTPDEDIVTENAEPGQGRRAPTVPQKTFSMVAGYAAALTLLFLILWATGRISLTGAHQLESLPDIAPLQENEFQHVPAEASLPRDHSLKLGESQRFGDVIITPVRVTTEPIAFVHMTSGNTDSDRATAPVLKLWFEVKNASDDVAFPPWDVALMCSRSPAEGTDNDTKANSWLMIHHSAAPDGTRILNYFHPPTSEYDLVGQHSRQLVQPGQAITTYVASSSDFSTVAKDTIEGYRWRLQLRKGVHRQTENGVTTLVEVAFTPADISTSG